MKSNWISLAIALLLSVVSYADSQVRLPANCINTDVIYRQGRVILHAINNHKPQLYFFFNKSDYLLMLNHEDPHPSASAGWGSSLRPRHWSAFMVTQPRFSLTCATMRKQKVQPLSCHGVLVACYFKNFIDQGHLSSGTIWIAENLLYSDLIDEMKKRKLYLHNYN